MSDKNPIICAIDTTNLEEAETVADSVKDYVGSIKLGLEFYSAHGPEGIKQIYNTSGLPIFLDLKLYDIPNTVSKAIDAVCNIEGVFMTTVHASGGREMLRAAVEAANKRIKIIAVTVLTSMDDRDMIDMGIEKEAKNQVVHLATAANRCGLDGVVCSTHEVAMLKGRFGTEFELIVPGIRMQTDDPDDQKRVATPKQAISQGANYLVIGRPITKADNPSEAAKSILDSI